MKIKDIYRSDCGEFINVQCFKVANDLDLDFVCIQEKIKVYKSAPFNRIREGRGAKAAFEYLATTDPVREDLLKEHVYDSPIAVDLYDEIMWGSEALECIDQL